MLCVMIVLQIQFIEDKMEKYNLNIWKNKNEL